MAGNAVATEGLSNSSDDVINQLRITVVNFAELKQQSSTTEQLGPLVKQIEGQLLLLQTLNSMNKKPVIF
ncbi:MAG TPA: hypothetical protein VFN31_00305 [Candidatus Saccharimonadales bacterium]|nr:hypothetical protein [Candidatus Saccharimonadales bacterium]